MIIDDIDALPRDALQGYARSLRDQLEDAKRRAAPDRETRNLYLHVYGGLGNQLFQAAFAMVMSEALGAELNILTVSYRDDELRPFLLHMFPGIRARIVPGVDAIGASVIEERMVRHLSLDGMTSDIRAIIEDSKRVYFSGFWQDERYFRHRRQTIRDALQPQVPRAIEEKAKRISEGEVIGLHVRRHGYGHMGLARLPYYLGAIEHIRQERGEDIPVKCFTDDPSFCRYVFQGVKNFSMEDDGNTYNPITNFHLLSSCRHHIIANSSFSWWAAWLNERDDSIIFAPHPWIIPDPETNPVPQRWRQVPNAIQAP